MTTATPDAPAKDQLLRRGEVARILRVNPRTVTRWAEKNLLTPVRLPGGERRYARSEIAQFLPSAAAQTRTG